MMTQKLVDEADRLWDAMLDRQELGWNPRTARLRRIKDAAARRYWRRSRALRAQED